MGIQKIIIPVIFLLFTHSSQLLLAQTGSQQLLNALEGKWNGEGTSLGLPVKDEVEFSLTIDKKFLHMKSRSVAGDNFIAEGYLWYNNGEKQFEFYEFNNGRWPVRILKGSYTDSTVVLEEKPEGRYVRLTITLKSKDQFIIEEANIKEGIPVPFVQEVFTRKN